MFKHIRKMPLLLILCALPFASSCSDNDNPFPYGPPQVSFPVDEGSHSSAVLEWWYGNFILKGEDDHEYGAMVGYFKPSMRIISILDIDNQVFYHDVHFGGYGVEYAEGKMDVNWEGDRWWRTDPDNPTYRLDSYNEIACKFDLVSEKQPLLVGGTGLSENGMYYYSLTRLKVEGDLEIQGVTVPVTGIGWLDHQWGNPRDNRGWDWFSAQLDNNAELIFWQTVKEDETIDYRDLTVDFPDEKIFDTRDISLERLETWTSPHTGRTYGTRWRMIEKKYDIDLTIEARFDDQEILSGLPIIPMTNFWEGNTIISGTFKGKPVTGVGYAELTRPF